MSGGIYAFQRSTSEESEANIRSVMEQILNTLASIFSDIHKLEPCWSAAEADYYYSVARRLNRESESIGNILTQVESALTGARTGTDQLR